MKKDNNSNLEQMDFVLKGLIVTPEQKKDFIENNDIFLTNEQLEKIPDILDGNKLSDYQKKAFAMGERIDFLNPKAEDELKASFYLTKGGTISSFFNGGEENVLKSSDVKFEIQSNLHQQNVTDSENFNFLKNNLKYLGFGDKANDQLAEKMGAGLERFSIDIEFTPKSPDLKEDTVMKYSLNFNKSPSSDRFFFNSYDAKLQEGDIVIADQTFPIRSGRGVTSKEAYNFLQGRAINTDIVNKASETVNVWMKLNTSTDGPKRQYYNQNFGFDLETVIDNANVKFSDKFTKENLIASLKKGNLQSVIVEINKKLEQAFMSANPQFKKVDILNSDLKPVFIRNEAKKSLKPWESKEVGGQEYGNDLSR